MNTLNKITKAIFVAAALFASSQVFAQDNMFASMASGEASVETSMVDRCDRGGDWRRPHRGMVCEARNRRGMMFRGHGRNTWEAERNALNNCYSYSRRCHIVSCHRAH